MRAFPGSEKQKWPIVKHDEKQMDMDYTEQSDM